MPSPPGRDAKRNPGFIAAVFILFACFYSLTGPGRVDIIDGQFRFEVAWNIIETGQPTVRDVKLPARISENGARYSYYGIAASVTSLPLVWLGYHFGSENGELARFLFSLTSGLFAAATLALLMHWWLRLGIPPRRALGWVLVVGLATLFWPAATSTFDQTQHAFFVLASLYAGTRAKEAEGNYAKGWTALSGLCAGVIVLYQQTFVILAPLLALSHLDDKGPRRLRPALQRLPVFFGMLFFCVALAGLYNFWRWGSFFDLGAPPGPQPKIWGNPVLGVLGLLVSPGKGILWYSPVVLLQLWSLRSLRQRQPNLFLTVSVMAGAHLLYIGCLRFYGGDWCWGPRYLAMTLPLLALGLPFLSIEGKIRRMGVRTLVAAGVLIQLMGLSMETQGFFFAHALEPWFWTDQSFNYRHSQLGYRARELYALASGVKARRAFPFSPSPYATLPTYCIFGTDPALEPEWMKDFPVFYVPRPWPIWMAHLPSQYQPVPPLVTVAIFAALGSAAAIRIRRGLRAQMPPLEQATPEPTSATG